MNVMRTMQFSLLIGLLFSGAGLYLLYFTDVPDGSGIEGIFLIVILITVGLLFLIPAKVYIIIQLMAREKGVGKSG